MVDWMTATAEGAGVPYQVEISDCESTDARALQISRAGVLAGGLMIPGRYMHSQTEMVDLNDVNNAVHLLQVLFSNPIKLV
jgi:endoglucanase